MFARFSRSLLATLFLSGLSLAGVRADVPQGAAGISRQEFSRRLTQVSENTTEAQLLALLGKPDYIGHSEYDRWHAVWFYGCEGPRQLPTLATIYRSEKGPQVRTPIRGGSPPSASTISEPKLRKAIMLLDQMPSFSEANPGVAIRVANELRPLGKTKILAAIKEYARVIYRSTRPDLSLEWKQSLPETGTVREALYRASTDGFDQGGYDNLIFLLRILFDIPVNSAARPGQTLPIPCPAFGSYKPPPPFDPAISQRFPVALFQDIPLRVFIGSYSSGTAEIATDELPYFEKFGRLRTVALAPSDHPDTILADCEASPLWLVGHPCRFKPDLPVPPGRKMFYTAEPDEMKLLGIVLKLQVLRRLAPLYPDVAVFDRHSEHVSGFTVNIDVSKWDAVMADLKAHPVRWNRATNGYDRRGD